jgi:hypothetical protein
MFVAFHFSSRMMMIIIIIIIIIIIKICCLTTTREIKKNIVTLTRNSHVQVLKTVMSDLVIGEDHK